MTILITMIANVSFLTVFTAVGAVEASRSRITVRSALVYAAICALLGANIVLLIDVAKAVL